MATSQSDLAMSKQAFSVSYNGSTRADDHTMDVEALAPALLAFGKLIREANVELNGKKSISKVLVTSDFEHKCFNVNFEAVVGVFDAIKSLIGDENVKSAKEVLEWIGIVKPVAISGVSLLGLLAFKRGRQVESAIRLEDKTTAGHVALHFAGESSPVVVHNHIYALSENPKVLKATRDVFSPIGQDGFETLDFKQGDEVLEHIPPEKSEAIIASCNAGINAENDVAPNVEKTTAWLSVYSPVYDETATSWRFRFGREVVYADISETTISHNALERGGAMAEDSYHVRLEVSTSQLADGKQGKPTYKITEVIKFIPATPEIQNKLL